MYSNGRGHHRLAPRTSCRSHGLWINVSKTNLLVLSPKRRSPASVSVTIKGEEIMQQNQVKSLGVLVDKDLNWKAHIAKVRNKCFAGLYGET